MSRTPRGWAAASSMLLFHASAVLARGAR